MDKIIYVVGFGPGDKQFMTMQAVEIIEQADLIVGYTTYTDILKAQFPDKKYLSTPMRKETDRCRLAVEKALEGNTVAMVSSGDSGIYGMAGIMLEITDEMQADVEIVTVPGITAASTAASVLGAPLMHDLSLISLSDLMTPLELIFKRVDAAASADFVISLYNPKSRKRVDYLEKAADIIMKYRDKGTPVGIVRNAGRPDQKAWLTTLSELKNEPVDMFCVVIIGNSQTYVKNNRMITPRGYKINEQ
ncbi:MAG: precorrin-3B C(17)-methyltransferase [Oscillospiraceae bacterium]|nr:precorrin-3B C(17)-methyltransferase [Oscillospiraceae bacterium]